MRSEMKTFKSFRPVGERKRVGARSGFYPGRSADESGSETIELRLFEKIDFR